MIKIAAFFLSFLLVATPVLAATEPVLEGTFDGWKVYSFNEESGGKVCFMSEAPEKQEGDFKKRGDVRFFVTRWESQDGKDVVSMSAGYPFADKATVKVKANGKTFELFTMGEMAWARDEATDKAITESLRKGKDLVIEAASKRGTKTKDTYSLKGSGTAHNALKKICASK